MKKLFATIILALASFNADAMTWYVNGILYGNVCRNGPYYTIYPMSMGQPVNTQCPIRNNYGQVIGFGIVTAE